MKKGQELTGKITELRFPNQGIMECEDGRVIVKNTLPGQTVHCQINKYRKGKAEARLIEVVEKSPLETESVCPHFGVCGGCNYISLAYEKELAIKQDMMKQLLNPVLEKQTQKAVWDDIYASPVAYGYRNKMEFTFGDEYMGGPLVLGMHKRGSFYDIVPVTQCQIVDEDYRKVLSFTQDYFREKGLPFFHRLRHEGFLRHLLMRKAAHTGEIMVALVTSSQMSGPEEGMDERYYLNAVKEYCEALQKLEYKGTLVSVLHTYNDSLADTVQSDRTEILYGRDYINETILGLDFQITEFSFFQTNSYSAEVLYSVARDFIQGVGELAGVSQENCEQEDGETKARACKGPVVYDLYSGTGTIAQLMAPAAGKVIGVEIVEEAVEAAKINAVSNGLANCEFLAGDVLKVLDTIEEKPDVIILDPPRDGVHPKALDKIIQYGVEHILYISCKPTSLARDLDILLDRGYYAQRIAAVNQFPWTGHCETVCLLSQVKGEGC